MDYITSALYSVLIESDWNLKWKAFRMKRTWLGINRIRLEFKDMWTWQGVKPVSVLIESDWNLKLRFIFMKFWHDDSINRIRLEFKAFISAILS